MSGKQMQTLGGTGVIFGFFLWFGGEIVQIQPFSVLGIPVLFAGAYFYFKGRKLQQKSTGYLWNLSYLHP